MHLITRVLLFLALVVISCLALPSPDSAGIVPRPHGLAYGGIPYGSVSGAVANYRPPGVARRGPSHGGYRPFGRRPALPAHLLNSVYI